MTPESSAQLKDSLKNIINLYSAGQLQEALNLIEILHTKYPNQSIIYNINGACYSGLNKFDSAIKCYKKAIEVSPNYSDAYNNLGNALLRIGNLDEAAMFLKKAIIIKPDYIDAIFNLGSTLKELGQLEESNRLFKKVISLKPNHFKAHLLLGLNLKIAKQYSLAIIYLEKVLELRPKFAPGYLNIGNIYSDLGQKKQAIQYFEKALIIKPEYKQAQYKLNALTGKNSKSSPKEYVENLFNGYAENFDESLVNSLGYNLPFQIKDWITKLDSKRKKFNKVIDLGCGTGLSGKSLREISKNLTGIDLSKNMVEKARELEIYDDLLVGDIEEVLSNASEKYDLFVALDVFVYLGDLEAIFKTIKLCSNKNAYLIFSVEIQEGDGFSLLETLRFSHSEKYILNTVINDFNLIKTYDLKLRKHKKSWIKGKTFILQVS